MHSQVPAYFNVSGLIDFITVEAAPERNGDFSLVSEIPASNLDEHCTCNTQNPNLTSEAYAISKTQR